MVTDRKWGGSFVLDYLKHAAFVLKQLPAEECRMHELGLGNGLQLLFFEIRTLQTTACASLYIGYLYVSFTIVL